MKKVVIIGRPNVGKSSFINRLLGKKTAITAREEGVTRDIRYYEQTWNGKTFEICDTGGVIFSKNTDNPYQDKINGMIEEELNGAHKILFMVDFNHPDHPEDLIIKDHLKRHLKKLFLIINKVDNFERQSELYPFFAYGIDQSYPVSALQGNGIGDVLDDIVENLSVITEEDEDENINVALIGKPNAGKSSLYNAIFNQNKAIVDHKMGTTRDINESIIKVNNNPINFMDTAGLRRKRKISDTIEYFSIVRTERAIEKADVIVFMIDAEELLTDQDKKILNHIFSQHKNCMIFVNKWDLLERNEHTRNDIIKILEYEVPQLSHYPIIMGSAKEKHNIQAFLEQIIHIYDASKYRVPTGPLNKFLERFFEINHPPSKKGKQFKIFYATQVGSIPPQFIFKVNDAKLLTKPFLRNFEREFRNFFPESKGVGMRFDFRSKTNV
ncbi:ribosome biogenesis GTPase Der [Candidatus Marinamargulisbacteria bacterium SCGC AG-343-K17]|nr:ribosome biogenesis GTPase Der [Candidatus Marinamargulisbacteria bacterium SCGC AG-343-K17]